MKRLLVGSVFAPTPRNARWYDLQLHFLRKSLGDSFDHAVYLNRVAPDMFTHSEIIGAMSTDLDFDWFELDVAITEVIKYFERNPDYDYYLILDSDAFPFRPSWLDDIVALMKPVQQYGLVQRRIAAPVRTENLDSFPHGCVLFIDGDYLRSTTRGEIRLITNKATNFLGLETEDMMLDGSLLSDESANQLWMPLMRTNTWNPHPIISAIYGHMFYHHGAGSRSPIFRAMQSGLFRHFYSDAQTADIEEQLFELLCADPEALCAALAEGPDRTTDRLAAMTASLAATKSARS
jgi:hypothetical protein